jgi:ribosome biogenesis GTPase
VHRRLGGRPADAATSATVVEVLERRTAVVRSTASRTSQAQVLSAVKDGYLTQRRLDSYHRLQRENTHAVSRTGARLSAEMKRQDKQGARLRRAHKHSPNFEA